MTNEEFLAYNQKGLIPGPTETQEQFLERTAALLQFFQEAPSQWKHPLTPRDWEGAHLVTETIFDFKNDWLIGFYCNQKLSLWQGAATWIEGNIPVLQLREGFRKGSYLKLYDRNEVLSHEAVHGARLAFNEPIFEEMLAYCTSKKAVHKLLGPFFRTANESYGFILLLFLPILGQVFSLFWSFEPIWLYVLPMAVLLFGSIRLFRAHRRFAQCLKKLNVLLNEKGKALAVMMRLSDEEIMNFAKMPKEKILEYVDLQKEKSLRWKMIALAYF